MQTKSQDTSQLLIVHHPTPQISSFSNQWQLPQHFPSLFIRLLFKFIELILVRTIIGYRLYIVAFHLPLTRHTITISEAPYNKV